MKTTLLTFCGVGLQLFAIFGNSLPYPLVLKTLSPDYYAARQAYSKLIQNGVVEEGDTGFTEIRRLHLRTNLLLEVPPIPLEFIEGVTIVRFRAGEPLDPSDIAERTPVIVTYSEGTEDITDFFALGKLISAMRSRSVTAANLGILLLGVLFVYAGLQLWLPKGRQDEEDPPSAVEELEGSVN